MRSSLKKRQAQVEAELSQPTAKAKLQELAELIQALSEQTTQQE